MSKFSNLLSNPIYPSKNKKLGF